MVSSSVALRFVGYPPHARIFRSMLFGMLLAGCGKSSSETPGALIVALSADMSIPKDVTHIRVKIKAGTEVRHELDYTIAPDGAFHLPGTLSVVEGSVKNPAVSVEVLGVRRRLNNVRETRTFSKAVVTIPTQRITLLQVPIQWLCDGSASPLGEFDAVSSCDPIDGQEAACVAGRCQPVAVDASQLPSFVPGDIFGGGAAETDPAARCFPTLECFESGFRVALNDDCAVTLANVADKAVNFAIELPPGGDGICDDSDSSASCYVPLDRNLVFGWSELEPAGRARRFQLPPAACSRILEGKALAIRATTSCESKTLSYPACGPWSAIDIPRPVSRTCGNGTLDAEPNEDCDGDQLGGATCASEVGPTWSGPLGCNANCTYDASRCLAPASPRCGDGRVDGSEQCDQGDLGSGTCANTAGGSGLLRCNTNCTFDTSACVISPVNPCGNGQLDSGEDCDGEQLGAASCGSLGLGKGNLSCKADCTRDTTGCVPPPPCGNGVLDENEFCDGPLLGMATCESLVGGTGALECTLDCTYDTRRCYKTADHTLERAASDLSAQDPTSAKFMRYVSMANRFNAGLRAGELDVERAALNKMLNSLSNQPAIKPAQAIDAEQTLFRIDLRDYGWARSISFNDRLYADVWEAIVLNGGIAQFAAEFVGANADPLKALAETAHPVVFRSDAFVTLATFGELYYAVMGAPTTSSAYEMLLGVGLDVPMRAGFRSSRVSSQIRMVERHSSTDGGYWKVLDFTDGATLGSALTADGNGMLAIFSLPNQLHGYFVADIEGFRIERLSGSEFLAALSCMGCHAQGILPFEDEVRPALDAGEFEVDGETYQALLNLYPGPTALNDVQSSDSNSYAAALQQAGVPYDQPDPIFTTATRYAGELTLQDAIGDLGITDEEFRLLAETNQLSAPLVALDPDGRIERSAFEDLASRSVAWCFRPNALNVPVFCAGARPAEPAGEFASP